MEPSEEAEHYEFGELSHDMPAIFPEQIALQALIDHLGESHA